MQQHLFTQLIASAEEDANELDRLRRLLCLPRKEVDKVNKEICGRIYQDVSLLDSSQHILNNAFQHQMWLGLKSCSSSRGKLPSCRYTMQITIRQQIHLAHQSQCLNIS